MNPLIAQITAAYEKEMQSNREAVTAADLPVSYEAITDRWLSAVLCRDVPGAEVISHRLSEPDSGSSNRRKIYLRYNQTGEAANLPKAVFCKASHELLNRIMLGVCGAASGEVLFYNHIRPLLNIEAPIGRFAHMDHESFNSIIMMDDLTDTAHEFCNHKTIMTRQRAESQIRLLGTLHGKCYRDEVLKNQIMAYPTFKNFFESTLQFGMREGSEQGFKEADEVIPARLYQRAKDIWPATIAAIETLNRLPHTLSHGDVHLKNWYVAGNGEMGLSDWQCGGRANWGRDFAYTIGTALTVENRRAWERDLLASYLEHLKAAGGPHIEFDTAWDIYRQQMITALTWWTVTLCPAPGMPDMQPRDVTVEFIRRLATAMDDLGSLDVQAA